MTILSLAVVALGVGLVPWAFFNLRSARRLLRPDPRDMLTQEQRQVQAIHSVVTAACCLLAAVTMILVTLWVHMVSAL